MGFFELISENFMGPGGKPLAYLQRFLERFPIILHGVSLNIGGPDELDFSYLKQLKKLIDLVRPDWVSDHLCWTASGNAHLHDLLPLAYTEEVMNTVARRVQIVQDYLEVPFALENTSSYLTYQRSTMNEWDFVSELIEQADCGLMFDVNNVYVSAFNDDFDPLAYLNRMPLERIVQVHVAGHTQYTDHIVDTHIGPLPTPVLDLYRELIRRAGPLSTLIEWDENIPSFERLEEEVLRVEQVQQEALSEECPVLKKLTIDRTRTPTQERKPSTPALQSSNSQQSQASLNSKTKIRGST